MNRPDQTPVDPAAVGTPADTTVEGVAGPSGDRPATMILTIRDVAAWVAFVLGVLLLLIDVLALRITGVAVAGVVSLLVWAFLVGVFTRDFWFADDVDPDAHTNLDHLGGDR